MSHGPQDSSLGSPATRKTESLISRQRPILFAGVGALLLATSACVGSVGSGTKNGNNGGGGQTPGGAGSGSNLPGTGGGGMKPGQVGTDPPAVEMPGTCGTPMFSTVMTQQQYVNTVSDLLGFDVSADATFTDANGRKYRPDVIMSALEAEGIMDASQAISDKAVTGANLTKLLPCDPATVGESKCADQFIDQFGSRATRRPLADDARADLRTLYDAGQTSGGFATGVKWVVQGLLQSPEFLYHLVAAAGSNAKPGDVVGLDDFALADRVSYFLWNSGPDDALWTAAAGGQLHTTDQLTTQVDRMRKDPKAVRARSDFYRNLLSLDLIASLTRDDPAYTPELSKSLFTSALAGIDNVYQTDGKSDSLFGSPTMFVDAVLAKVYGGTAAGADFMPGNYDKDQRRGLLTHPAMMAIIAEHDTSDPIHRGQFVYTKLLCQNLPPPPDGVPDLPPLAPNLTTRQRLVAHRAAPQCAACHALFDPIGLAFENFDALGRFRSQEHGLPVDSSGELIQTSLDVAGKFADGPTLMDKLSHSADVRSCLAQGWYEYASRRDSDQTDKCGLDGIKSKFMGDGDLNDLLASIALSDSFRNRLVTQE